MLQSVVRVGVRHGARALVVAARPLPRFARCETPLTLLRPRMLPITMRCRLLSTRALEENPPDCPQCAGANTYFDGVSLFVCPDCSHDWAVAADAAVDAEADGVFRDGFGTVLQNGDSVILSKELKAGSVVLKKGTKVKSIRLGAYGDGHDISCTIPGKGAFHLKTQFVKKA
ncbi:hypothetical protein SPRG_01609 [Saprolegnia parasitica CBS 223.65]|uniref:Alkylphosphonate utilization operon protein PhnA n=1 Tax=Saprolegnia parasitica (strain CBS 223.65) TaxID=695850 RepID=A0A067D4K2_SAPPC|nr:hypothetical protein SPRG_01609 [Saprolegnia parasitica CBS 223.65]KDO33641.1 hypothetical protein SPRG_01609 [Saprolegnia parasitica CBS 223.65]|eukprot:XP_012195367.1 hypothetical protein SPRG_01609 [Saprolegnia parasitica CBS 223.65]